MIAPYRLVTALAAALSLGCSNTVGATGDAGSDAPAPVDAPPDAPAPVDAPLDALPRDVAPDAPTRVPMLHRADNPACGASPRPGPCMFPSGGPLATCRSDADCSMGRNGRCITGFGGPAYCGCTYDTCTLDADCHTGGPCACHGAPYSGELGNTCVPGNCQTDANCGPGGYCSPTRTANNCGALAGYYCHTPGDLCVDDADCPGTGAMQQACSWQDATHRWECTPLLFCV